MKQMEKEEWVKRELIKEVTMHITTICTAVSAGDFNAVKKYTEDMLSEIETLVRAVYLNELEPTDYGYKFEYKGEQFQILVDENTETCIIIQRLGPEPDDIKTIASFENMYEHAIYERNELVLLEQEALDVVNKNMR